MKFKLFTCSIIAAIMTFAAGKAAADPLFLTSFTGTNWSTVYGTNSIVVTNSITVTNGPANTTTNKMVMTKIGMKQLMTIVSNEVSRTGGGALPADAKIAFDPLTGMTFATNTTGYFTNLAGIVSNSIPNIATAFHPNSSDGKTGYGNNVILLDFRVVGTSTNSLVTDLNLSGRGQIRFNVNTNGSKIVRISAHGAGFGAYNVSSENTSRQDGVFEGSVVFEP